MLSVTEIMLLRFYTDYKENKDHHLTVFSVANTHVRT